MNYYIEKAEIKGKILYLEGWVSNTNAFIEIKDGKKIKKYKLNIFRKDLCDYFGKANSNYGFKYEIPISKSKVRIRIIEEDNILYNNNVNNSILNKIKLKIKKIFSLCLKSLKIIIKNPQILFSRKLLKKYIGVFKKKYNDNNTDKTLNPFDQREYIEWIMENEIKSPKSQKKLTYNPLISFIIPVYNPKIEEFKECIKSIKNQTYKNYEVCIVDDCSTNNEIIEYLKFLETNDKSIKVKYHKQNQHISKTSNDALKMCSGEFIALIDNDDTISNIALEECIKVLNNDKSIDFIYSDFDKLDKNGLRCNPYFKPDYSPDTLLSFNYLSHFNLIRKSIINKVGGFDENLVGAQDYDLYLKISEITNKIYHIPKILYHWRMSENSTSGKKAKKNYAFDNGKKAIEQALKRRKIQAIVETKKDSSFYTVKYLVKKEPKISIIIPTRDYADILKKCIDSILEKTKYQNYEIIIVDNGSKEKSTIDLFKKYLKDNKNIKIIEKNCEFNYSYLNNEAVKSCNGEYIVLLNNDTEVITPEWLEIMVGYAMQPHIGTVGVKLLYPDNTIQHGGVVLGLGGVASHSFIGEPRNYKAFNGLLEVPTNYAAVTAACLMIEKRKFLEIKGLDEKLKVAYNDVDLNIRLLEKGYYNIFLPQVELYHHESKSRGLDTTGEKYERFLKESNFMYEKWSNYIKKDPFYNENYSLTSAFRLEKSRSKQNEK